MDVLDFVDAMRRGQSSNSIRQSWNFVRQIVKKGVQCAIFSRVYGDFDSLKTVIPRLVEEYISGGSGSFVFGNFKIIHPVSREQRYEKLSEEM